ncbi:unnamed protein product [Rhizophagus irregularis]|nr:unnamed protein product [Rhizophagus irregularis]
MIAIYPMASMYIWILQCLMKATNNITPKAFWTDSESGLINAAAHIFPTTPHFYCLFHIWQNITKHLKTKLALNSASSFYDIEKVIDKKHEAEFQYCKLANLKVYQTTVRLPHLSSQFFSNIDVVLNQFLTPLNLVDIETANDNFIEDIIDEPQITLASLLNGIETSNIIEMWRIQRIEGLSRKDNLVILLDDGTHLCTCLETITKGIICHHFWRVMLYSHLAKFHISIIPIRWYKNNILSNLDINLKNSPILTAIETSTDITSFQITSKTAINVALETNSDHELITLLKDFIESKREKNIGDDDDIKENHDIIGINESSQEDGSIIPLQKDLIEQITDPHVTKIRRAPSKKRLKSAIEVSKKKNSDARNFR